MTDLSTIATVVTAVGAAMISYLLQKPYVRVVKMFVNGQPTVALYKLKNAGPATAVCIVLQDRYGHAIDLDLQLGQLVKSIDALPPSAEITVGNPNSSDVVAVYCENLFGLLFHTELVDGGNRFQMSGRKTWPWHKVPPDIRRELPHRRWRRR